MRYRHIVFYGFFFANLNVQANVLQYLAGISYSNPAELFKVKKADLIVGSMGMDADVKFVGSVLNLNTFDYDAGISHSKRASLLPYGRIARRLSKKVVFGVDITEPFHSNLVYGDNSFTRYACAANRMRDNDVSPRLAFNISPKFNVGAGLNFNFLQNNEVNWALPISQTQSAILINKTSSFGVGYDLGMYLMISKMNFFGASYYSSIKQNTQGESRLANFVSNDIRFNFRMPATTILNFVHIFNKKWLASAQVFRSEWNANQYATIRNTAAQAPVPATFIFPMKYQASIAVSGALRRQINEKLGLTLIGMQDDGPERNRLRTITFPSDVQNFIALNADYHPSKTTTIELLYGKVLSYTNIDNQASPRGRPERFTIGFVNINADVVDLRLKIQV